MHAPVKLACEVEIQLLPLAKLLPTKTISADTKKSSKFKCIAASVLELGIIEPLVVFSRKDAGAGFLLLDGHVRLEIMRDLGETEVPCLVATDDEAFTYNHKVNRLTVIQEHFMVLRAIKNGLSEQRLAKALDPDVGTIRKKADLLDGICPEAVQLLKEKRATAGALREIRKAKPMRQMEIAESMRASSNYSVGYAK